MIIMLTRLVENNVVSGYQMVYWLLTIRLIKVVKILIMRLIKVINWLLTIRLIEVVNNHNRRD